MTTKRKLSNSTLDNIKIEANESITQSLGGSDYMVAKGRLQGVLKLLTERSDSDNSSSHDGDGDYRRIKQKRQRLIVPNRPTQLQQPHIGGQYRHTYVMKLFDRSVDLAKFEEDTPLYPICRAWMANQPRNNASKITSINQATKTGSNQLWVGGSSGDVWRLPPPKEPSIARIPSPTPEQRTTCVSKLESKLTSDDATSKDDLIRAHLKRWVGVKRKWIRTASQHEDRYAHSKQILQAIYNKAQDTLLE